MPDYIQSKLANDLFSVILFIILIVFVFIAARRKPELRRLAIIMLLVGAVLVPASAYLFSHAIVPATEIIGYLLERPSAFVLALLIGGILYWLRGMHLLIYAVFEILVGSAAIAFVIANPGDLNAKLMGIIGGIYIVIRGMDNLERGMPQRMRTHPVKATE